LKLVGFGHAEVGVEGERMPVVVAGASRFAEGVMDAAEAGVGAGVLVAGADGGGDGVRRLVVGDGVGEVPERMG
jgi:hypothetical protein